MKEIINHYSQSNRPVKGRQCMVFVDQKTPQYCGGRVVYGIIVDVFQGIITVEITQSKYWDYQKHAQLFFSRYQVWPFARQTEEQLTLFV